ncbi:MAG: ABC transporter ATP-binding protein, partial [Alphaproteobacteria bacterium]|nr:ABC transporter ATP-binding protein [Alphaproteobacteria bacterium]
GGATYTFDGEQDTGHMINVLTNETRRCTGDMKVFGQVVVSLVYIAIYIPTILSLQFNLMVAVMGMTIFGLIAARPLIESTRNLSIQATKQNSALASEFIQFVHAIPYLKATATLSNLRRHVRNHIKSVASLDLRMGLRTAILGGFKEPIAVIALLTYIVVEIEIYGGSLAEIAVVAFLLYRLLNQVLDLPSSFQRLNQLTGSINSVLSFSDNVANAAENDGVEKIHSINGSIQFTNVGFSHGETTILQNISLTIPQYQTIGIVGESGAGKTMFFNLLTGLLDAETGTIQVAGNDYRKLNRESLRRLIGYVPQDPVIINDTIANNIGLYSCDPLQPECHNKIMAAAKAANCEEFLLNTKDGLNSLVGERGTRLSGGQRQRIAIARELFKDPELLIFDEATSALDGEAEAYVQDSIDKLHNDRTIVIIAHRLSTVRRCDNIYVFSKGTIIEEGSFDKLYADPKSTFRLMCERQSIGPF